MLTKDEEMKYEIADSCVRALNKMFERDYKLSDYGKLDSTMIDYICVAVRNHLSSYLELMCDIDAGEYDTADI